LAVRLCLNLLESSQRSPNPPAGFRGGAPGGGRERGVGMEKKAGRERDIQFSKLIATTG